MFPYCSATHSQFPYAHSPFLSVIILAFVKSSGKTVGKSGQKGGVSETTALLSDQTDSLEGSLRDKVVSQNDASGTSLMQQLPII